VTGLCLEILIDRELACVVRPHERDADTVAIQIGNGESPPVKVSVPQRLMGARASWHRRVSSHSELSQWLSRSWVDTHEQLIASAAIRPDVAPDSLMLHLSLPYGHSFIVRPDAWVRTVAVCPVGMGLHGPIEVLLPPAVLSTSC